MTTQRENILEQAAFDKYVAESDGEQWLQDSKKDSWKRLQEQATPTRLDQNWRFASLFDIDGKYVNSNKPSAELQASIVERSKLVKEVAGSFVFADNYSISSIGLSDELKAKGVIWTSLENAAKEHPELFKKYCLSNKLTLGSEKWEALNAAYCQGGTFLYVPKNVVIEQSFVNYHWSCESNTALFPKTVVIAEDNSRVSQVDYYFSENEDSSSFSCESEFTYAMQGAKVTRHNVQNWNEQMKALHVSNEIVDKDAVVKHISVCLGGDKTRSENIVNLNGAGSDARIYSLTVANKDQEFDQRTQQIHTAPNAFSELLYKNVLLDKAHTIFSGMINVEEDAQLTDAYQTNRNLLLSDSASADAIPGLEISANDVKCSHGTTTGRLDADELFYMSSRGIPLKMAQELMVLGFLDEVIEKIENEELADSLRELVAAKFKK